MSTKFKFVVYTGLTMALMPVVATLSILYILPFLPIPGLSLLLVFYQSAISGAPRVVLELFRYVIPGFQLSGDLPPISLIIMFIIWIVIGIIYGRILYGIQSKSSDQPRFGLKNFIIVIISQIIFGYIITYIFAAIFNMLN